MMIKHKGKMKRILKTLIKYSFIILLVFFIILIATNTYVKKLSKDRIITEL